MCTIRKKVVFMSRNWMYFIDTPSNQPFDTFGEIPIPVDKSSNGMVLGNLDKSGFATLFTIPDSDNKHLKIFNASMSGLNQIDSDVLVPTDVNFDTATTSVDSARHVTRDVFFSSATAVVRVCFAWSDAANRMQVANMAAISLSNSFPDPLDVTSATKSGFVNEFLYVARSNADGSAGDMVTLAAPDDACTLSAVRQTFIAPVARGLSNAPGALALYWTMHDAVGAIGRLYQWDLTSPRATNATMPLAAGGRFAPMGFVQSNRALLNGGPATGMLAAQVPGESWWTAHVFQVGDEHTLDAPREYCTSQFGDQLPDYAIALPVASQLVLVGNNDAGTYFLRVQITRPRHTPTPSASLHREQRRRDVLGTCPATPFGYPPTCSGCAPPQAVCGVTLQCDTGCCFVHQGQVTCCSSAPAAFGQAFVC
eukprot:TRINITY_DN4709_c0_g1_i1.p1 TRINITY_DN4709_c0_g1~~TRINITY_DN4709_c0_g1_i1.p1  ORF type:complete len:424 (-),score=139.94 TRINITY_DN4709_c0_g1_i1:32-1303(-)